MSGPLLIAEFLSAFFSAAYSFFTIPAVSGCILIAFCGLLFTNFMLFLSERLSRCESLFFGSSLVSMFLTFVLIIALLVWYGVAYGF